MLNALVTALIAALAIELRLQLDDKKSSIYIFFNKLFYGERLYRYQAFSIEFFITFIVAVQVYLIMYLLFNFGGGMMIENSEEKFI